MLSPVDFDKFLVSNVAIVKRHEINCVYVSRYSRLITIFVRAHFIEKLAKIYGFRRVAVAHVPQLDGLPAFGELDPVRVAVKGVPSNKYVRYS